MKCERCEQEVGNNFSRSVSDLPICYKCWDELGKMRETKDPLHIDSDLSSDFGPFFTPGWLDL